MIMFDLLVRYPRSLLWALLIAAAILSVSLYQVAPR